MKRFLLMSAALSGGMVVAAETPGSVPTWTPPPSVWREPIQTPVMQNPAPMPGVPAPMSVAMPSPVPATPPSIVVSPTSPAMKNPSPGNPVTLTQIPVPMSGVPAPTTNTPPDLGTAPLGSPQAIPRMSAAPLAQSVPYMGVATAPLPALLNTPLPTTPSVPPLASCSTQCAVGGASCPPAGPVVRGTCLARMRDWLFFQPGPPVLPTCQPARYQAPIRDYFPCVGGAGCGVAGGGTGGCGAAAGCGAAGGYNFSGGVAGNGLRSGLGNLRGLIAPAGHGGGCGDSGGVLGPIAGGCGEFGLIGGGPLSHLAPGCGSDGCVNIKHKGLGARSTPSTAAPVTGPIGITTQSVGVPLPASCIGSPTDYNGCYAGCNTVGNACRAGAGGQLLDRLFGRCGGACASYSEGGNGFSPTSVVPVISGYVKPQTPNFRYADPLFNGSAPQFGQPRVDGVGPELMQSSHSDPTKPFTRP